MPSLKTPWQVDEPIPLPEYPRPQMAREVWLNLNGRWQYAVRPEGQPQPQGFDGQIRVPYAIESEYSGVSRAFHPGEKLWYQREFDLPSLNGNRWLLHFGAVDYACEVWLNGAWVGRHQGGFLPFSFEVTDQLQPGQNTITVAVTDPTDTGMQQRGKQVLHPKGIWYTAVSGIWQTVWLEPVPATYITDLRLTPTDDLQAIKIEWRLDGPQGPQALRMKAIARLGGAVVAEAESDGNDAIVLAIPDPQLWHPDHPTLYDLELELREAEEVSDRVASYFALRKFGKQQDVNGFWRFTINDEPLFLYGPLDQGYWPEGLYTPPSYKAMRYDLEYTKAIGCNMVRKHVKVEPLPWYRMCDELGLIVWQDMPNGGKANSDARAVFTIFSDLHRKDRSRLGRFGRQEAANQEEFTAELQQLMQLLYNVPSLAVWVPFNEGWGQFEASEADALMRSMDPTRLVDHASGWNDQGVGDFQSRHVYFRPVPARKPDQRIQALTEFGGYSLVTPGHVWDPDKKFGYKILESSEALTEAYLTLLEREIAPLIAKGLACAIYTQTTDVESEVNGYLTYDRRVEKMDRERITAAHHKLIGDSGKALP